MTSKKVDLRVEFDVTLLDRDSAYFLREQMAQALCKIGLMMEAEHIQLKEYVKN